MTASPTLRLLSSQAPKVYLLVGTLDCAFALAMRRLELPLDPRKLGQIHVLTAVRGEVVPAFWRFRCVVLVLTCLWRFGVGIHRRRRIGSRAVIFSNQVREEAAMAFVIAEPCIGVKDTACVDACPVDCIHPKKETVYEDGRPGFNDVEQLYIDPVECIDCGACVPVCPVSAIFALDDLPEKWQRFTEISVGLNAETNPRRTSARGRSIFS